MFHAFKKFICHYKIFFAFLISGIILFIELFPIVSSTELRIDDEIDYIYRGLILEHFHDLPVLASSPLSNILAFLVSKILLFFRTPSIQIFSLTSSGIRHLIFPILCLLPLYKITRIIAGKNAGILTLLLYPFFISSIYVSFDSNTSHAGFQFFYALSLSYFIFFLKMIVSKKIYAIRMKPLLYSSIFLTLAGFSRIGDAITVFLFYIFFLTLTYYYKFHFSKNKYFFKILLLLILPFLTIIYGYSFFQSISNHIPLSLGLSGRTLYAFRQGAGLIYKDRVKINPWLEGEKIHDEIFPMPGLKTEEKTIFKIFQIHPKKMFERIFLNLKNNLVDSVYTTYFLHSQNQILYFFVILIIFFSLFLICKIKFNLFIFLPILISVFSLSFYSITFFREGYLNQHFSIFVSTFGLLIFQCLKNIISLKNDKIYTKKYLSFIFIILLVFINYKFFQKQHKFFFNSKNILETKKQIPVLPIQFANELISKNYILSVLQFKNDYSYVVARYTMSKNIKFLDSIPEIIPQNEVFITESKLDNNKFNHFKEVDKYYFYFAN